jgi:hypothetical protein
MSRNQLSSVSAISPGLNATYDALSRRRFATSNRNNTIFFYDGSTVALASVDRGNWNSMLTVPGSGEVLAFSNILSYPNPVSTTTWVPLHDLNGSTIAHVDSTGSIANSYTYDPNGTTTVSGASIPDPYEFGGMEMDPTGLYHTMSGYYSTQLVRSLSEIGPTSTNGGGHGGQPGSSSSSGSSGSSYPNPEYGAIALGGGFEAGNLVAAGIAVAGEKAFGAAFWAAFLPAAGGIGPAGWVAIGAVIVVDVILEIFDPFGGGDNPILPRQLFHRAHSIQFVFLGTIVFDETPVLYVTSNRTPLQPIADITNPTNGNVEPGFKPQDGVCSAPGLIGGAMNALPGVLACCKQHDDCYTTYGCNSSSWGRHFPPFGPCNACNAAAVLCIGGGWNAR